MYKSDVHGALKELVPVSGGVVERLMAQAQASEAMIYSACAEVATNNDPDIKKGLAHVREAVSPVAQLLAGVSPSGAVVELHQLSARFDAVLRDYPELEGLLRFGRQALAALAGAFDLFLQQNKRAPSIVGLIAPAASLGTCYAHYSALQVLFKPPEEEHELDVSASVEIDGADLLGEFASYVALLSDLARIAKSVLARNGDSAAIDEISIVSIESGSPIRISLTGDAKALQLLLSMLRDVARIPYLYLSSHGRAIQTMETFARARELGIDSPEVLTQLQDAMVQATGTYAQSIKGHGVAVTIDGKFVQQDAPPLLGLDEVVKAKGSEQRKLPRPSEGEDDGE